MSYKQLGRLIVWRHIDRKAYRQYGLLFVPAWGLWGCGVDLMCGLRSLRVGVAWEKR